MRRFRVWLPLLLLAAACSGPVRYSWQNYPMDGSRTGVTVPSANNVSLALGTVDGGVYTAPNGRVFRDGVTPVVAGKLIAVQPRMARLKEVIGQSARYMEKFTPECELGNCISDAMLATCQALTGRKADVSLHNFGGIRVDMPAGDITLDVVESMLPFRNYISVVGLKGADLRKVFEKFAVKPLCVGGARLVLSDGALTDLTIGGKPVDDKHIYYVVTNSFLLDGGDGYALAKDAVSLDISTVLMNTMFEGYIRGCTAADKQIDAVVDGRVTVR